MRFLCKIRWKKGKIAEKSIEECVFNIKRHIAMAYGRLQYALFATVCSELHLFSLGSDQFVAFPVNVDDFYLIIVFQMLA